MRKLLVTGATGFIGKRAIEACLDQGVRIAALAVPDDSGVDVLDSSVEIIRGSLDAPPWKEIEAFEPESCLHCAWVATDSDYLSSTLNAQYLEWSRAFVRGLIARGVDHFVGVGSCAEYVPFEELKVPVPLYVASKIEFKEYLQREHEENAEFNYAWARVFYAYGLGEPSRKLVSSLLVQLQLREACHIETPDAVKDFVNVRDVGSALSVLVAKSASGVFDLGSGVALSIRELATMMVDELEADKSLLRLGSKKDSLPVPVADIARLCQIGWAPEVSMREGVREMIEEKMSLCPGCRSKEDNVDEVVLPSAPLTLNYLYKDHEKSLCAPSAPLCLRHCHACGLVYAKQSVNPSRYDVCYENTQTHSELFIEHLRHVRNLIGEEIPCNDSMHVLEVGCGKGDFLKLLCEGNNWTGDGYDTTYVGPEKACSDRITFHSRYLSSASVDEEYDLIVCRHVIEHVEDVATFLVDLNGIANKVSADLVMIETPRFEWIREQSAVWDLYHEHKNYFEFNVLMKLCQKAGFSVVRHEPTFEGQYQNIFLRPNVNSAEVEKSGSRVDSLVFDEFIDEALTSLRSFVSDVVKNAQGLPWIIWGAGAKGVCLANLVKGMGVDMPAFVVDLNPAKQGGYLPVTGLSVHAPQADVLGGVGAVVVMNINYLSEVEKIMRNAGVAPRLLPLVTRLYVKDRKES